jgi:hypothetical protein
VTPVFSGFQDQADALAFFNGGDDDNQAQNSMFSNNAPTDQNSSLFGNNPSESNSFSHNQADPNPFGGSSQPVGAFDNTNNAV